MIPEDPLVRLMDPPAVETVAEAVDRMKAIDRALPVADGVAWFNKLYLRTTEEVVKVLTPGFFRNPAFMQRLDVVFANLYFRAVSESIHHPDRIARAWRPLFEARAHRGVAPIQFALAGMNAHVNRDLALAVVETCSELGVRPGRAVHEDYTRVNRLLEETQEKVKRWFATGFVGVIDRAFGPVDDVIAIWSLTRAREASWTHVQTLWFLRSMPELTEAFVLTLDRMVGFAGRGLLVPTT